MIRPITSASNLHRRKSCPGSARLEALCAPEPDNDDSKEGTLLHTVLGNPSVEVELTNDQKYCVQFCQETRNDLIAKIFGNNTPKILHEVELFFNGQVFGHADFVAIWKDQAIVLDWKMGRIPVDSAEANLQTRAYAVMISDHFGVENVIAGIVQPRLAGDERVSVSQYGLADIEKSRVQIESILKACEAPDAPLVPSRDACRYCLAKIKDCPAVEGLKDELATVLPANIEVSRFKEFWIKAEIVEGMAKAIKKHIGYQVLLAESENRKIPGMVTKQGNRKRDITDASKCFEALVSAFPETSSEDFIPMCDVSIKQAEDYYLARRSEEKVKVADKKAAFEKLLTDFKCLEIGRNKSSVEVEE